MQILLIVLAVVVVLVAIDVAVFLTLSRQRKAVDEAWADVERVLEQRRQLADQLLDAASGVATDEPTTLQAVRNAQDAVAAADTPRERAEADVVLGRGLSSLAGLAASHPALADSPAFTGLVAEVDESSRQLDEARTAYDRAVADLNAKVTTPPTSAVARRFGFNEREPFAARGEAPATGASDR